MSIINDRRAVEADVLALVHETLLGEALNHSSMLAFAADDDMRYVAVNDAACQLLGYSRSEILQLRVSDIASEVTAPTEFAEMVATGSRSGAAKLRAKAGKMLQFVYVATETRVSGIPFYLAVGVATPSDT